MFFQVRPQSKTELRIGLIREAQGRHDNASTWSAYLMAALMP